MPIEGPPPAGTIPVIDMFTDAYESTLVDPVSVGGTTLVVAETDGAPAADPSTNPQQVFRVVLQSADFPHAGTREVVAVTDSRTSTWTCTPTVNAYQAGDVAAHVISADALNAILGRYVSQDRFGVLADGTVVSFAPAATVTSVTHSGTTVTVGTSAVNGVQVGDKVTTAGIAGITNCNGDFTVTVRPSDTTFRFTAAVTPTGSYTSGGQVFQQWGGTGNINEGQWNLILNDPAVGGLSIRGIAGGTEPLLNVVDFENQPIGGFLVAGGFYVSGDNLRILPPGDIENSVIKLRKDGSLTMAGGDLGGAVGGFARGNVTTPPPGSPDGTNELDSETSQPGVVDYVLNGIPFFKRSSGTTDEVGVPSKRRLMVVASDGGAATVSASLIPAPTLTGTAANGDSALNASFVSLTTGTSSGDPAGVFPAAYTQVQPAWLPMMHTQLYTGTVISTVRYWCGLFSADPHAISSPTSIQAAGWRYDTGADVSAFWRCVSSAAGTPQVTVTTLPVTTSHMYQLRVEWNGNNTAIRFLAVNPATGFEQLYATHTTMPTFNVAVAPVVSATALAGSAARAVLFSRYAVTHVG